MIIVQDVLNRWIAAFGGFAVISLSALVWSAVNSWMARRSEQRQEALLRKISRDLEKVLR